MALDLDIIARLEKMAPKDLGLEISSLSVRGEDQVAPEKANIRFDIPIVSTPAKEMWGGQIEYPEQQITLDIFVLHERREKAIELWEFVNDMLKEWPEKKLVDGLLVSTIDGIFSMVRANRRFSDTVGNDRRFLGLQRYVVTAAPDYEILQHTTPTE